ncbi:MAG: PKD domain-containing protein, partial [Acidobacteriota bacterium]
MLPTILLSATPPVFFAAPVSAVKLPSKRSTVATNATTANQLPMKSASTPSLLPRLAFTPFVLNTPTAVIKRVLNLNSGRIEGSAQQLSGENVTLDGSSVITQDLLVPGSPNVQINGQPTFAGVLEGSGDQQPNNYTVTIKGNASLRNLITRTNPFELQPIALPPAPAGTRDVSLTQQGQSVGDFSTLRNLTLSGQAGSVSVPPGTYGNFTGSGQTSFVLGVANSTSVYNLQELTLSGSSTLRLAGPVILTVANGVNLSGLSLVGEGTHADWLLLKLAVQTPLNSTTPGLKLSGNATLHGLVLAPTTLVKIDGGSTLDGALYCDRLTLNGTLKVRVGNQSPAVDAGSDQSIGFGGTANLSGAVTDDGLPNSQLTYSWSKVSGPGEVTFADASALTTTATFSIAGTYVLRLTASDTVSTSYDEITVTVIPQNQAPEVNAGADLIITLPNAASLTGSASDDGLPTGSPLTYQWSKLTGSGEVSFANATQLATTASFTTAGVYVLRLTATDGALSTSDDVQITVHPQNQPPVVNAGTDQTITLPSGVTLNGIATDDGLPTGSSLNTVWSKVSGAGDVTFANANALVTAASFNAAGTYVLRLTASDSELTTSDEVTINVIPQNQAPQVSAGQAQTITLPNSATLNGTATDDGLPSGSTLTTTWSKVSGAGDVTFANPNALVTTVSFSVAGVYVVRLSVSDTELTSSDEITITVIPQNQPPQVSAGADQVISLNLLQNPGNEKPLINGEVEGWTKALGNNWTQATAGTNGFPQQFQGATYFYAGDDAEAELRQDVDISAFAATIASGNQQFSFKGYVRSLDEASPDSARIVVEYRDGANEQTLATFDSGQFTSSTEWALVSNLQTVPAGTSWIRVRLIATRNTGTSNDAFFDGLSLQAIPNTAVVKLIGAATDDGLPFGSSLTLSWSQVSGPGTVTFTAQNAAITQATFTDAGTYVLRLTATDSQLTANDEVTVIVQALNQPPTVNAGADQTITLPTASVNLSGIASDEGLPPGSALTTLWSKVSGAGDVSFADANALSTSATFSAAGTYTLRLTVSDGDLVGTDELTVTVNPQNQPPQVSAGADQTVTLPNAALLNGSATDDGLPAGSSVSMQWSVVTGAGDVTFTNATEAATIASFTAAGVYVLRLTATDSELSASDDVTITVIPANQPPQVSAGADQTITLPGNVSLNGTATDDGLPSGSSLTYEWSKVSGAGEVTFTNSGALVTTAGFSQSGIYVLRLTASDSQLSASDDVVVTVNPANLPPTASFSVPSAWKPLSATVVGYSSYADESFRPENLLDEQQTTIWRSANQQVTNQFILFELTGVSEYFIDRVRLQSSSSGGSTLSLKDFDIQISTTTTDAAAFTTVLSGTMQLNVTLQQFVFPGGAVRARYVKLVAKNNYGSTSNVQLARFQMISLGSADSIISLPGQPNAARNGSPALIANGAVVLDFSSQRDGNSNTVNQMLDYNYGGWISGGNSNQFVTIQLAGAMSYALKGVKIAPWVDGNTSWAVRDFEVWVSNTTTDTLAFNRVLTASVTTDTNPQTFLFPGGTIQAKYVKYIALNNHGGNAVIGTDLFDVITENDGATGNHAAVVGASSFNSIVNIPELAIDSEVNSQWTTATNQVTNQWIKIRLESESARKIYGVRILPNTGAGVKDFEIRVSTTTDDDAAFTTVYTGTATSAGVTQEFLFSGLLDAKYVQFFWRNGYHPSFIITKNLEVLAAPLEGAGLYGFSSQSSTQFGADNPLDIDTSGTAWETPTGQITNQWLKLILPNADLWTINQIALQPGFSSAADPNLLTSPKDFEIQVSTTDAADASFTTIFSGVLQNRNELQFFTFAPTQARFVRLLLKNNYGNLSQMGLRNFQVYAVNTGGTIARFIDQSTDADGQIVAYNWDFGDGQTSAERDPVHTFATPGAYTVRLTVTDNNGLTHSTQIPYYAFNTLQADFTISPLKPWEEIMFANFQDISSYRMGTKVLRNWDFGDNQTGSFIQTIHNYHDNGLYTVRLTFGDPININFTATKPIQAVNLNPSVSLSTGATTLVWGQAWTRTPSISDPSPVDRTSLVCGWDFGDGQTTQISNCTNSNGIASHAYALPGAYTATLTVTDKDGGAANASINFIVNKRPTRFVDFTSQTNETSIVLRAKLTDDFAGQPLAGKSVTFGMGGSSATATSTADGYAQAILPYAPGIDVSVASVDFGGDDLYLAGGGGITVIPPQPGARRCTGDSRGTDFWIAIPENAVGAVSPQIFIAAENATSGTLTLSEIGFSQNFTVAANGVTQITLPNTAPLYVSEQIENKAIHITTQAPVSVYAFSPAQFTTDGYLALPTATLGTNYLTLGYKNVGGLNGSLFAIAATVNQTQVTITPAATVGTHAVGTPYTITLNQGQTYQLKLSALSTGDLSGTRITATQPIAVFSGHTGANIPTNIQFANHIVEQMPPLAAWGNEFFSQPLATRTGGDTFRFLAAENNTRVYINGNYATTLNSGQLHEQIINGAARIFADKPILVAQYSNSYTFDLVINSDPSMTLLIPATHWLKRYTFKGQQLGSNTTTNYVNLVVPTSAVGQIILDGSPIASANFTAIGNTGYSGATITVSQPAHSLVAPVEFGATVYGFAQTDAYSHPAGMCVASVISTVTVELQPASESLAVNTQTCVIATVRDASNNPVSRVTVNFTVSGVNSLSASATTNAQGQAQFCYTGTTAGSDLITAAVQNYSATASRTWLPPNQAPQVSAGQDQTITLPATADLQGTATDDGLPIGSSLIYQWSVVTGAGDVNFANAMQAATTASFTAAGVYVLRLTASDTQLSTSDDVEITVNPAPVNQPPTVDSGAAQTLSLAVNLLQNASGEAPLVNNEIPNWNAISGSWTQATAGTNGLPEAQHGLTYFYAGNAVSAELIQDVNVSPFAASIAAGAQEFEFKGFARNADENPTDEPRVIIEYRDATNTTTLFTATINPQPIANDWGEVTDRRVAPVGTGWIRVRLIATRQSGATNDAYFDGLSLRAVTNAAATLNGAAADDGLPTGGGLMTTWSLVSGAGTVTFANVNAAQTTAVFSAAGSYVLRLTATDSQLSSTSEVSITVTAANVAPIVNAGADQTVQLPTNTATLTGAATDDGLPVGSSVSVRWRKVSGAGDVTFTDATQANTTATFSAAGIYVLRLTATDGDLEASDDIQITVNNPNQAPQVNAGADISVNLPNAATLQGTVTDDGLPVGSSVSVQWSQVSGAGTVTFTNATEAATIASFTAAGVYVLRLTASDGVLSASDDVQVTVIAANQAPEVNAGADQTISLPTDTVTLAGTATDDGLPAGSSVSVNWTKTSGIGTVTFSSAGSLTTTASFSQAGVYVLRLTATDSALSAFDEVVITVTGANQAPQVNAGQDQTINLPTNSVNLQGTTSDDGLPVGSSVSVQWSQVSGAGTVTFTNATEAATIASFTAAGVYVLRLTASDGVLSASDDVQVTVVDPTIPPPTVAINSPADGAEIKAPTAINCTVSDGNWKLEYALGGDDTLTQSWTTLASGSGAVTNAALAQLDTTLLLNGIYALRLSSTNGSGLTASQTIAVIVSGQMKVGNFTLAFSDLNVPVAGLPMEIIRSYDSRDKRTGDFGVGWQLGIKNVRLEKSAPIGRFWQQTLTPGLIPKYCLEPSRQHLITITFGDGRVYKFAAVPAPQCQNVAPLTASTITYQAVPGTAGTAGATLTAVGGGDVLVDGPSEGSVNLVTTNGLYNPRVFELTLAEGMKLVIEQGVGLRSMSDLNGNTLTINANGIIHSSGKSISFTRDAEGRITQITDPLGNAMTYGYDANGDLLSFTDRENNTTTFTYNATHGLLAIADPRGIQPIRNDYDANGRLIKHTDAFGKEILYSHDLATQHETISDRLGNQTLYEYDLSGNVTRMTDALGNATSYTYDARDRKLSETNAIGKTTSYTYDGNDNVLTVTDPLNNVTTYTYNTRNQVLTVRDARGNTTSNVYNGQGNLTSTTDALTHTTSYAYNAQGLPQTMTDAAGQVTNYFYSSDGNLLQETDAHNHVTTFTYDANHNRLTQTTTRTLASGTSETLTTSYEYDKLSRLTKTTYADGTSTRVSYNSIGQQAATFDPLNRQTSYEYDAMGRLVKTTYADGTFDEATYDAEGRRLTSKDRLGSITAFTYDALGRLTKTTYADGSFTQTAYDAIGRVVSNTDALNHATTYEYDPNCGCSGRRAKITDALGNMTQFTYDAVGNQATMTDARNQVTTFEYDALNRRVKTIYADSTFDQVAYDALGRNISKTDQAGKTTQFAYDALGRLVSVTDALNQVTRYAYDELGNQVSQTDALSRVTRFEYDKLGRRLKRTLPLGQVESYSYNSVGNLTSRTDFKGKTTTYAYDTMNRLLTKTPDASLSEPQVTFTYNALGQRLTMTDASGTTTYGYDTRHRLIGKQTPQGTLTYTYDNASNLLTMRSLNGNGASVNYSYDALNRLSGVTDNAKGTRPATGSSSLSYDAVGNLASFTTPNQVTHSYTYNSLNRLTDVRVTKATTTLASYAYTLGAAGNRLSVSEQNG